MRIEDLSPKNIVVLTPEQKQKFQQYLPGKVYKTERNISILVALSQLCMILLFLNNPQATFDNIRSRMYFILYVFLLISTLIALFLYRYTFNRKKHTSFLWLRRGYACTLCIWVLGITGLEQMGGRVISVYCYLLPTTAALLLLTPLESTILFGGTWAALACILIGSESGQSSFFGNMVNGTFVTILTLFISYRYYRSMAVEFCDRRIIDSQYKEIQKSNVLFQEMAHIDQLTRLYNRHYLLEKVYPLFAEYKDKDAVGLLLMLDIDFFKQYNDTYGHMQGDECLKQIAEIVKQFCIKNGGNAIRYGGEEFLLVMMDQEKLDGEGLAQNLLQDIWNANISRADVEFGRVTASIGLWCARMSLVQHIEQAIKCADDALYEAKSSGRNKIVQGKPHV